jgi:hypothetical protein
MRALVQVLAGPPTIPPAHGHLGQSSTLPLPARPTGSCQPCATTSGGRVLRTGRRRLDQLVQGGRDGSVPPSHDVLIAQGSGRGGMLHPHHQLPSARARRNRQGGRRVCRRSWKRNPSTPAARIVGIQTRRVKLLRRIGPPRSAENTSPSGPGLGIGAQVLGQRLGRNRGQRHRPQPGAGLGRPEGKPGPDLQELLGHRDPAVHQVVLDLINESRP